MMNLYEKRKTSLNALYVGWPVERVLYSYGQCGTLLKFATVEFEFKLFRNG